MGSVDVDVMMMFFLPRTIPRVPGVKIAVANGDKPCAMPNNVFHMKPSDAFFAKLSTQA